MTEPTEAHRARRRAHIEAALGQYPHLSPDGLQELTDYFTREATALDVGLIASNEAVQAAYRRFRADHIDPLRARDWLFGTLFAVGVAAVIGAIIWRVL